jgi:hypothetical protein
MELCAISQLLQHLLYNNVGAVKQKITTLLLVRGENLSRAPEVGRSSETLDRFRRAHTMGTGTKRNEVQLSFVPY